MNRFGVIEVDIVETDELENNFNGSLLTPVGSIGAWFGGYCIDANNGGYVNVLGSNSVSGVNLLLDNDGWRVCNGEEYYDELSPIFNVAGRYLPNLTDDRFLQGNSVCGGIGGSNSILDHTHNHSLTADGQAHTGNSTSVGNNSVSHNHTMNHDHASATSTSEAAHRHLLLSNYNVTASGSGLGSSYPYAAVRYSWAGAGGFAYYFAGTSTDATLGVTSSELAHTHTFDVPAYTGSSGGQSATHNHTVAITHTHGASAVTGSVGSGDDDPTNTDNRPKYLNMLYIMKVR
jgi:hypothetical protein